MIQPIKNLLLSLFSQQAAYRVGRALYHKARGDVANDMASNGEMLVQRCVVEACLRGGASTDRLVIFDVGANIGDWSAALLDRLATYRMGECTDLYLFEPVPSTAKSLRNRLGERDHRLHYEHVALSSENGEGTIYVRDQDAGTNSLHSHSQENDAKQIRIVKATATDFCTAKKIDKVQLLKCDTEGHDMEVIRGALPLLADERISVLQFEYNHRWVYARNFLRDAFVAVEKLPYRLVKLQPHSLLILAEWHPELERFFEGNYALVHVGALEWFPTRRVSWDSYNTMCVERQ